MLCKNCNIEVAKTFVHAISNNICPACGKNIMDKNGFEIYAGLKTILEDNKVDNVDEVMCAILMRFDVSLKDSSSKIVETKTIDAPGPDIDSEPVPKINSEEVRRNKDILQKMRDEALQEALQEKYGDEVSFTVDEEMSMHEVVSRGIQEEKRNVILSGTGGSFRRS